MRIKERMLNALFIPEEKLTLKSKLVLLGEIVLISLILYLLATHKISLLGLADIPTKLLIVVIGTPLLILTGIFFISLFEQKEKNI